MLTNSKNLLKIFSFVFVVFFSFSLDASLTINNERIDQDDSSSGRSMMTLQVPLDSVLSSFLSPAFGTPVGAVVSFAGRAAPDGWLLCYGQAVDRQQYADLYKTIEEIYGSGDGHTTFNVPDLRGRTIFGEDAMGGPVAGRITAQTFTGPRGVQIGGEGGEEMHALTLQEMPSHTHTYYTGTGEKTHHSGRPANAENCGNFQSLSTNASGGSLPHNNIPPAIILNYIIKY